MDKITPPKRIPLVDLLRTRSEEESRAVLILLASGTLQAIKEDSNMISTAERILFNLDVLLYCDDEMKNVELGEVISAGMELDDVQRLFRKPNRIVDACEEIEKLLAKLQIPQL